MRRRGGRGARGGRRGHGGRGKAKKGGGERNRITMLGAEAARVDADGDAHEDTGVALPVWTSASVKVGARPESEEFYV